MNSLYHYLFGLDQYQEEIIEKQKRLRHLMLKQIRDSKIKLKPHEIPVPQETKKKKNNKCRY
jgi:hypothetical protein